LLILSGVGAFTVFWSSDVMRAPSAALQQELLYAHLKCDRGCSEDNKMNYNCACSPFDLCYQQNSHMPFQNISLSLSSKLFIRFSHYINSWLHSYNKHTTFTQDSCRIRADSFTQIWINIMFSYRLNDIGSSGYTICSYNAFCNKNDK
jgi:hypothetical protein